MQPLIIAAHARKLMTDHVSPSKGDLLKYRMGVLTDMKIKIGKAAEKNKKFIKYFFPERYIGDGWWFQKQLRKDGFAVESWASGSMDKNHFTIAWVGDAPSPLQDSRTWMIFPGVLIFIVALTTAVTHYLLR